MVWDSLQSFLPYFITFTCKIMLNTPLSTWFFPWLNAFTSLLFFAHLTRSCEVLFYNILHLLRRVNQSKLVNNRKCYIIFTLDKAPVKLGIPRLKSKQTFLGGVSDCLPTIFIKLSITYMYLICTQRQKILWNKF